MRIEFIVQPLPTPAAYWGMAPAEYLPLLNGAVSRDYVLPIAAIGEGTPLGLGLAKKALGSEVGEILSLFVEPRFQSRGIGTKLLELLETGLAAVGCRSACLGYFAPGPASEAVDRILQKRSWGTPEARMILLEVGCEIVRRSRWMQKASVPVGYEFFRWVELRPDEKESLEIIRETVPAALWPFQYTAGLDEASCLGLRCGDEVIGWMIVQRRGPGQFIFSPFFIREPWRSAALNAALFAEATRRAVAHHGDSIVGLLEVQIDNAPMRRLLERKFQPYAIRRWEMRRAEKELVTPR